MSDEAIGFIIFFLIIAVIFTLNAIIYFIPTIIAVRVQHSNRTLIFLINLLLGWTVIGWLVALLLALKNGSAHGSEKV